MYVICCNVLIFFTFFPYKYPASGIPHPGCAITNPIEFTSSLLRHFFVSLNKKQL